jgi:hypothetical protein
MRLWLRQETAKLKLAAEERIKEATQLVRAYSSGHISSEEANQQWDMYIQKWPDRICNDREIEGRIEEQARKIGHGEARSRS